MGIQCAIACQHLTGAAVWSGGPKTKGSVGFGMIGRDHRDTRAGWTVMGVILESRWFSLVTVLSLSAVTVLLVGLNVESPLRALLALVFIHTCPGLGWIRLLRLNDLLAQVTLTVALSLTLTALLALGALYLGRWSPPGMLLTLVMLALAGVGAELLVTGASARRARGPGRTDRQRREDNGVGVFIDDAEPGRGP